MDNLKVIEATNNFVREKQEGETTGHDWWHTFRVWHLAKIIAQKEKADLFVVEIGALLHDISDWKFSEDEHAGSKIATEWLTNLKVNPSVINQVVHIVDEISFKGAKVKNKIKSLEGKIVQDADRLDALGALGIARCLAYGGSAGRPIYLPGVKPQEHSSFETYKKGSACSINHFYEKLLLLKDLMNTKTGQQIAIKRHKFVEKFLDEFYLEWDSKDVA